jgi:hypothetical protein
VQTAHQGVLHDRDRLGRRPGARTAIIDGPATAELGDDELIEAVMGRLDQTSGFSAKFRALLSMMP